MSLLDDITGAVTSIMTGLPELTGTLTTKNGDTVTVIYASGFISKSTSVLGMIDAPSSSFDILQANILATGMNLGDYCDLTDSQGNTISIRLTSKGNALNFVTFSFEAVNQ